MKDSIWPTKAMEFMLARGGTLISSKGGGRWIWPHDRWIYYPDTSRHLQIRSPHIGSVARRNTIRDTAREKNRTIPNKGDRNQYKLGDLGVL